MTDQQKFKAALDRYAMAYAAWWESPAAGRCACAMGDTECRWSVEMTWTWPPEPMLIYSFRDNAWWISAPAALMDDDNGRDCGEEDRNDG
jgi:hypothetical protein